MTNAHLKPLVGIRFFGLLLLACLSLPFASAQTPASSIVQATYQLPSLFADQQRLALPEPMGMLIAPLDKPMAAEQLLQSPWAEQFKPWQPGMALPTSPRQDVWLRLAIPQQNPPQSWMLRIPRLSLAKATVYQRSSVNPSQWLQQSAGLAVPNSDWPVRARDPIFELSTRSDQTQLVFVRLENAVPVTENIQLIRSSDFGNGANYAGTLNGLIIGIFTMLTLIGLVSWRLNLNSHFGWFALFSFVLMWAQLTGSGYMNMRVWSDSLFLPKIMAWVMAFASLAAMTRFVMSVSSSRDLSKPIYVLQWTLITVSAFICIALIAIPFDAPRGVLNIVLAGGMLLLMASLAWIAWRSQHWLWMIFASLVPVVLSVLARLAYNLGWVAHMEIAVLAGVITAAFGLILVYTALIAHQRQRVSVEQNEDALETKDAATGLFNERIAIARLPQIILRSKRFGNSCGAILVRWHGYELIKEGINAVDRGRVFAHLGNRLSRLTREIDTVARLSDDQFLFLVEAPISHEQLSALASKILTSCMRSSPAMPEKNGFDLHLAVWLSSEMPADAPTAMELLKTRINQMREGTQRRVQFITSPMSTRPAQDMSDPEHAQRLVEKINELEKTHGLPTINLKSGKVEPNRPAAGK